VTHEHNRLSKRFAFDERHEVCHMIVEDGQPLSDRTPIPASVVDQP
jgi:hypothetical protein